MRLYQRHLLWALLALSMTTTSGCAVLSPRAVPPDFMFILDARGPREQGDQNWLIRINAKGQGHFELYNAGTETDQDQNGMVVYDKDQVVETGDFRLRGEQVRRLWQAIRENNLFQLTDDYCWAMGCC